MPPNHGLWPNDRQRRSHIREESVESDEYQPVERVEAKSLRRCPPQNQDLLAQNQVLGFKCRPRSEQPDQQRPNYSAAPEYCGQALFHRGGGEWGDGNEGTGDEASRRRERSETADGRRNPGHGKGSGSRREDSLQGRGGHNRDRLPGT